MSLPGLEGKLALVTGGARGIGKAVARRLLQQGSEVVLWDRDDDGLRTAVDELSSVGSIEGTCVDISNLATSEALVAELPLDILVNNAAVAPVTPLERLDPATFDRVLRTNSQAAFFLARRAAVRMRAHGRGSIVNMASVNGLRGQPQLLAYNASKAALVSLTQTMAVELAAANVRVNCVCPGSVWTEYWEEAALSDEDHARFTARIPAGRFGAVDEIAWSCAFLASDAATYITGHALVVDGGLTARP